MTSPVTAAIIQYREKHPEAKPEEIADHVRATIPGCKTSKASVSSVLSRLKHGKGSIGQASMAGKAGMGFEAQVEPDPEETDDEARARITVRYAAYRRHTRKVVLHHSVAALICSGPPGLGKSYEVRRAIEESGRMNFVEIDERLEYGEDPMGYMAAYHDGVGVYDMISGSITAVGLYQALWYMRKGGLLVLDDADAVFHDPDALNLLKAALDTELEHRRISWRKEARWLEEYGMARSFLFEGSVVFLTNIDFEGVIQQGRKDADHFKALIDRSNYLCLTLRGTRDFLLRIRQVAEGLEGMIAKQFGLDPYHGDRVLDWIEENKDRFYNLSLRLVGQVCDFYKDAMYLEVLIDEQLDTWVKEEELETDHERIDERWAVDDKAWQEDAIATKTRTYS